MTCTCVNVKMGSYDNSVPMWTPWKYHSTGKHKLATVDRCLSMEILTLWGLGIKTTECCCGHKKVSSYISVYEESIEAMRKLGYQNTKEKPDRPDIFYSFEEGLKL